ncbi:unnamed protein product, partial [Adineta steineri]
MHKVSLVRSALEVFQKATEANIDLLSMNSNKAYKVYVRLMFLRIGEIDTLNEKYQAQIAIESRWSIELDKISSNLSSDELNRLLHGKSIAFMK